jgi:DNA-binding XRE family transcriptional regulator
MTHPTRRRHGNVCFVRYKLGLSQQQLAESLGVSRSLIAMFETGKRKLPRAVNTIYLDMCRKAEVVNPEGVLTIKRGRKPAGQHFSSVTNCKSADVIIKKEAFKAKLQQRQKNLGYQHIALQHKKEALQKRAMLISDQLFYVTTMQKVCSELVNKLPEGKVRDRYELLGATYNAKQIRLKQQYKKCSPVAILQTEFQINVLKSVASLTEKIVYSLNMDADRQMSTTAESNPIPIDKNLYSNYRKSDYKKIDLTNLGAHRTSFYFS